jgi:YidC/Oxa1 family membrane protein insertase
MSLAVFQPLQTIVDVFEELLKAIHSIGIGWGFSIIVMTIVIRIVLFPLTYKQFKSMRALQTLAPEMKKLQEKYKDDRQRLNQEMMKFYQENKVNPFGSCLPLLMQMPVFIALFYMLRKDLKVDICGPESDIAAKAKELGKTITETGCDKVHSGSGEFLFIHDLTAPATGGVLIVLLVLYVGSQLLSSLLMSTTADRNQRMVMLALPFVFVLFVQGFPAGLLVYWITTNFWTVGQGWIMRRNAPPPPTPPAKEGAKPARGKPPSAAPAAVAAAAGPGATPPPPPRKKKKRSGRRR